MLEVDTATNSLVSHKYSTTPISFFILMSYSQSGIGINLVSKDHQYLGMPTVPVYTVDTGYRIYGPVPVPSEPTTLAFTVRSTVRVQPVLPVS